PDVELGPVGQWEYPQALAGALARVVERPELRPLLLRVPAMAGAAEREHSLLGAALLLVAPRAPEGGVEAVFVERLAQGLCLHDIGMDLRAMGEGADTLCQALLVDMNDQLQPEAPRGRVAELVHGTEFPGGIHVQQRERR